jgi:hypothetical protein
VTIRVHFQCLAPHIDARAVYAPIGQFNARVIRFRILYATALRINAPVIGPFSRAALHFFRLLSARYRRAPQRTSREIK